MPPPDLETDDLPDMAAAELALGLLDGAERSAALRRVLAEPGFARAVAQWRSHVAQLFDLWPEIDAPNVFARVERSLDNVPETPAVTAIAPSRSRIWPGVAALSSIAAAGLLVVLVTRPVPVPPVPRPPVVAAAAAATPTLVASIDPTAQGVAVTALYDRQAGAIRLTDAALTQAHRSAELWIIPADGTPHSLGLLHAHGTTALTLSAENRARIAAGATLAVTLEPVGGSPSGLPTGPIVAKGALSLV